MIIESLTLGKIIGLMAFILTEVLVFMLIEILPQRDFLAIAYIQLTVFGIVWGAVGLKHFKQKSKI
jgi:hypothetical protein